MPGPSLQLGVSAAGQESVAGLNAELVALRSNLAALKTGKADLSSLAGASQQLTLLRKDIANGQAGLQTAFADLAETIKAGFQKTANASQEGASRTRSLASAERAANQALYDAAIAQRAQFTATELAQIRAGGVQLVEADRQRIAAIAAVQAQSNRTLGEVRNPLPALQLSSAADTEVVAAYAQHQKLMADQAAAAKAEAWVAADLRANAEIERAQVQGFAGFAAAEARLAAQRAAAVAASNKAAASGIAAGDAYADTSNAARAAAIARAGQLAAADDVFKALATAHFDQTAAGIAASKEAAWTQHETQSAAAMQRVSLQTAQGFGAIEREANATRLAAIASSEAALARGLAENNAFVLAQEQKAARDVAAIEAAAVKVAKAEADYLASTARAQATAQRQARSQLDQGLSVKSVTQDFGPTATGAAQAAASLEALTLAHQKAGTAAVEHAPKLKGLSQAMNDAHSAARGLASGFGAMFLTWGSLAPLLAGAAISNAFVQTVKQGASVEQTLEIIKQLSSETDQSIGMLRNTLLDLASNGPQGPKEVAEAMKALSLAGLNAVEVASSVKQALTLAIVGEMPAQKAAEALVAISTAYGYAAGDFNRVNDVIAKTAAVSMSSVEGMTQSFRVASTVAQQYGVRLEDTATQLGLLANLGIRNQQAGTAVTQFYTGLAANTKKGHDALTLIVGDVGRLRDEFGNMKPAIEIIDMLNKGLARFSGTAQASLLSAVYNNRAQRAAVSNVLASRLPAYDENTGKAREAVDENGNLTGKLITQWEDMAKKVNESYGFAAIAMANLSLTAENQMKSVMSALQSSFVAAFKDIEPTVLVVSQQLRTAFNGENFRSTLSGITSAVANLIVTLVEHANVLKIAAEAWLIYKAAMIGSAVFSALAAGIAAIGPLLGAVASGAGLAAGGFALLRAAMGPIGLVLTAITAAWALYQATSTKASISSADIATLKADQIIEALNKESIRLETRNQLLRDGVTAREADIKLAGIQASADLAKTNQGAQSEGQGRIRAAENDLADLRSEQAKLNKNNSNEGTRKEFAEAIVAAERRIVTAKESQVRLNNELTAQQARVETAVKRQVTAAKDAALLENAQHKRTGLSTGGTDPYEKTPDTEVNRANARLTALKTIYAAEEAEAKKRYDQIDKIATIQHNSGQTSDIQYQIEQTSREGAYYAERIARLNAFIADSASALETMRNRPEKGRDQKAEAEEQKEQIKLRSLRSELELAQQITLEQQKARDFKQEADISKFISQQMQALALAEQQNDLKVSELSLTKEQALVEEARAAAAGKFTDEIRKQQVQLTAAQQSLRTLQGNGNASAANDFAGAQDPSKIAQATAAVDALQSSVTRLQQSATTAGTFSAQALVNRMKPQWQTLIDGWSNVQQRMTEMYDATVSAVISTGETAFTRLAKTGKVSATEMLDAIRDILIKNMYQSTVAPAMAALGKQVAEGLFGTRPVAQVTSPLDIAASKTAGTLDTMNNLGVQPATTAFARLVEAVQVASQALLNIRGGGGGGGGIVDTLTQLLSGGGDSGLTVDTGGYGIGSGSGVVGLPTAGGAALGATFGFARGSPFTNRTYSQPTRFSFGGGAAMGEMGEAGPEAVMPLKRGADGSLGVAYHGGGNAAPAPVSVVIENHTGGQVRQRETKKSDGSKEIRFIIDAAVDAVADSIASGGKVGGSIESTYGTNRAAGLPRR